LFIKFSKIMKSLLLSLSLFIGATLSAQTTGTLTLAFSQIPHTSYQGTKNVMAVWIESSTGTFVKTRARNAGGGTSDHLAVWAVKSGGSAGNCMAANCNVLGATTGATLSNFGTRNFSWDGTDAAGNVVPDGTYKIIVESTWNHGSAATTTRSFTFTKGPNLDIQTPLDDANFVGIALGWNPSGAGVEEKTSDLIVSIQPNPSANGVFNVEFNYAIRVSAMNLAGEEVYTEDVKMNEVSKTVNLSNLTSGVYFICVTNGTSMSKHKVVINK
jgi:hypothetical protein